mgnify:FL=1|tara:strand:- start:2108 stop:2794 length:687 start_codon:yes stop_codon:yes gene_type:complete
MLVEKIPVKKLFVFLIFILLLTAVFILKNSPTKLEKKKYEGVFFKRPFPLIIINPKKNLNKPTSFLILIENETNINSFFSKLESKIGSMEGKLIKVSGKLLTLNETRFIEISDELEQIVIIDNPNTYPSEQTLGKKIDLIGNIINLKCITKNDFSKECFYKNVDKGLIPALRIFRNKENIDYLLKIKDSEIINDYIKNNFQKTQKVFGDYYYQNGFNVINLDSISTLK